MKVANYAGVNVHINPANYYNANALVAKPGNAVALAVVAPLLVGAHAVCSYTIGTVATAVLGIDEVSGVQEVAVAGTYIGSNYAMMGIPSYEGVQTTLRGFHDAYRFTGELAVAAVGEVFDSVWSKIDPTGDLAAAFGYNIATADVDITVGGDLLIADS